MSDNRRKHLPSPALVSTDCSKFKSCLSLRRHLPHHKLPPPPPPPPPPHLPSKPISERPSSSQRIQQQEPASLNFISAHHTQFRDGVSATQAYWKRVHQVELELTQLDKWLSIEKKLTDKLNSANRTREECPIRLADRSYLCEIKQLGRPGERLVMQLSAPAIAETGSTAYEVLYNMASMGVDDLSTCLIESMPMCNVNSQKILEAEGKRFSSSHQTGFMETILMGAIEKLEGLVLEGQRIQIGASGKTTSNEFLKRKFEDPNMEHIVLVMLIQIRDPKKDYEAVGELMIGLVEASTEKEVERRFHIDGVNVAGIKFSGKGTGKEDFMWSAFAMGCKGVWDCCCWKYVRNPNIVFASGSP